MDRRALHRDEALRRAAPLPAGGSPSGRWRGQVIGRLLGDPALAVRVDSAIVGVARDLKILKYINPTNSYQARERFLKKKGKQDPEFHYVKQRFDGDALRARLDAIPVDKVVNDTFRRIYEGKRRLMALTIDLVESVGTPQFREVSERLFGPEGEGREPGDIADAAHFLALEPETERKTLSPTDVIGVLEQEAEKLGARAGAKFICSFRESDHLSSNAAAGERSVVVARHARFSRGDAKRLAAHEVGVHVLTAANGLYQPLKIFGIGLPGYLQDQEGLAIFAEFASGWLSPNRLRTIGGRALAVELSGRGIPFREIWARLVEEYGFAGEDAFAICERAFRGGTLETGGFTKDRLYLQGLLDVVAAWMGGANLEAFCAGKMPASAIPQVERLIAEGALRPPRFLPAFINSPGLAAKRSLFRFFNQRDAVGSFSEQIGPRPGAPRRRRTDAS